MLHFFLQAKPHTYSTTVSPYYKASVISSPPGALLFEHSGVMRDLQERPCPEAAKANKSQIVMLFTAVLWDVAAQATKTLQYKHCEKSREIHLPGAHLDKKQD